MVAELLLQETESRKLIPVSKNQHHERWLSGRMNLFSTSYGRMWKNGFMSTYMLLMFIQKAYVHSIKVVSKRLSTD
jgi:hypothetical protein